MSNRAIGVFALLAGICTMLIAARVALAGNTTLCRTYADAKYKGGTFNVNDPPLIPQDWEPHDPNDPSLGIQCQTLACTQTCWRGTTTNGFHVHADYHHPYITCDCPANPLEEIDSCHLIAMFDAVTKQFVNYTCMGDCEVSPQFCTLKISNLVLHFLPAGQSYSSADIECLCQE